MVRKLHMAMHVGSPAVQFSDSWEQEGCYLITYNPGKNPKPYTPLSKTCHHFCWSELFYKMGLSYTPNTACNNITAIGFKFPSTVSHLDLKGANTLENTID